jgi:hypothetical protein
MTLPVFILGSTNSVQLNKITMIFNLYKNLDKPVTQCFASIRMSNFSYAALDAAPHALRNGGSRPGGVLLVV